MSELPAPFYASLGFTVSTVTLSDSALTALLNACVTIVVACLTAHIHRRKNPVEKPKPKNTHASKH